LTTILGIYLIVFSIALIVIMRGDAVHERCPLLSTRNYFLTGIILFQSSSGAVTLILKETERGAELNSFVFPGLVFCTILTIFVAVFLWLYRSMGFVERFAWARTRIRKSSQSRLLAAGLLMTLIGVTLRFGGAGIPYIAVLLPQLSAGCLGVGIALVATAWVRSVFNFAIALVLVLSLAASSATLLVGAFGRREILGLFFSIVWALFYEKWRYMPATRLFPRLTGAMAVLSIAVLVFSASRVGGEDADRSLGQQLERITQIEWENVEARFLDAVSGQFAGGISMYLFETRLKDSAYDPLHSLAYFATLPIPRDFWPGKYSGLGATAPDEAGVTGVPDEFSWGPGLVGHLCNDIVFLSLPIYAFILAALFKYMDVRTMASTRDPMTVAIFGSALGQALAMPRGELGLFGFNLLAAIVGAWFFSLLVSRMFLPIDREAEYEEAFDAGEEFDIAADLDADVEVEQEGDQSRAYSRERVSL
jgi:hypothetical protein